MRLSTAVAGVSLSAILLGSTAFSNPLKAPPLLRVFSFALSPSEVVPPINSPADGWVVVTLDDSTGDYTVSGQYQNLQGMITNTHFHGPAAIGSEASPFETLQTTGSTSGSISGSGTLSAQEIQDMLNGLVYLQVHSFANFSGEIRGQVLPCPDASVKFINGTGVNPAALSTTQVPVFGSSFTLDLDCAGHAPSIGVLVFYSAPSLPMMISVGEVLVSLNSMQLFKTTKFHVGNSIPFNYILPTDQALCGLTIYAQGVIFGAPGPKLTNRFNLTLGT